MASAFLLAIPPRTALAICRVIESDRAPVAFDPTTSAFYVLAPDVVIGWDCPSGPMDADAGSLDLDAGAFDVDAGTFDLDGGADDGGTPPEDAGDLDADLEAPLDVGVIELDVGMPDAGSPDAGARDTDGTPLCADGSRATAVHGSVVSLVVQPRLLSGGGTAALIMPVPAHPQVVPATPAIFAHVRSASRNEVHETVEVIEDVTLGTQCTDPHYSTSAEDGASDAVMLAEVVAAAPMSVFGCAYDSAYYNTDGGPRTTTTYHPDGGDGSVTVEVIPTTDDYDVTLLSATDAFALGSWLDDNGFPHDADDDAAFEAYVGVDHWFVALRVHPTAGEGARDLAPLVVSWLGSEVPVTHRLQYDPEGGTLVTDAWVLAPTRMDVEDGSAITSSADRVLPVPDTLRGFGLGFGYLTHLRIARQQRDEVADSRMVPVANEVVRGTLEQHTVVRIPIACCPMGIVAPNPTIPRRFLYERSFPVNSSPPLPDAWLRSSWAASAPECASEASYGGAWSGGGGSVGSDGRPLRGCAVPSRSANVMLSWTPLALALFWLWRRSRRR